LLQSLEPAFRKYNEQQYATVKLPGSSEAVKNIGLRVDDKLGSDYD